jgi:L-iditol 2-dehydrogenase
METSAMSVPKKQRVVSCLGGGQTHIEERDVPAPERGELLLAMRCSGLCGTDLFKLGTGGDPPGMVLGHEVVGDVVAMGDGVTRFAVGDRVVVAHHVSCGECEHCRRGSETMCPTFRDTLLDPGGFCDFIRVRDRACEAAAYRIPDGISDENAVFMEPAACVLRGVQRAGLSDSGLAVIFGAGSMGLLHLLILKALRSDSPVLMVDPLAARREVATKLGADATGTPGDEATTAVRELSQGLGADAVFDTVGGQRCLRDALAFCRAGGSVLLFAHAPDTMTADFDLNELFKHEKRVIGTYSGSQKEQKQVFGLLESGVLAPSPIVTHILPLAEFGKGVELSRQCKALKVLYTP